MKKESFLRPHRAAVLIAAAIALVLFQSSPAFAQMPSVQIADNLESPIRITILNVEQGDSLLIRVLVQNIGEKPISTFAIRHDDKLVGRESAGMILNNSPAQSLNLHPGESRETIVGASSRDAQEIKLSVDFVEFLDGKTWGPDTYSSAEQLDGQRAGARAVTDYLIEMLKTDGEIAVVDAIASQKVDLEAPQDANSKWSVGFYLGVKAMRDRLFYLNRDQGLNNIETVLKTPFDAVSEFEHLKPRPTPEIER